MISDIDPRRWQERLDSRQIREDHTAMANLPRQFINREISYNHPVYKPGSRYRGDIESMQESFMEIVGE